VVGWSWDFGDGNTSTEQSPSHAYASGGTYTVTLTATDDDGASDTTTGTVTAIVPNQPPVAGFTYDCTGLACSFTDTSTDGDGTITNYEWGFGDGWGTNAQNPSHTYAAQGTYTVVHWVYDNGAASDTTSVSIDVGEAPVASFTVSCTDLTCDFTDTSTDAQGAVVAWSWGFGDGNTSTEQNPSHTYTAAGTYTVTLTATDDVAASDDFTSDVTVTSGNQPPTVTFTSSCSGYMCDFSDTSTDVDGTVVAWSWDFGDGNTSTEQSPSHTYVRSR
jgi:PKD repeat protein